VRMRHNPWRKVRQIIAVASALILVGGGTVGLVAYITRDRNPVPAEIRHELTFSPLTIPTETDTLETSNYQLSRSEDNTQILNFLIKIDGATVTVSQYPQPAAFTEIEEYKNRFLTNVIQQTDTVQTANGTIYLGVLARQDGRQIGVMLEHGLIIFFNPDRSIDASVWRSIGDRLTLQQST
jgi:hypothetical protein